MHPEFQGSQTSLRPPADDQVNETAKHKIQYHRVFRTLLLLHILTSLCRTELVQMETITSPIVALVFKTMFQISIHSMHFCYLCIISMTSHTINKAHDKWSAMFIARLNTLQW